MEGLPESITDFAGLFEGERIFIIGNGPSLNKTPLERLDSEYTLAMNKVSRIYSNTDWRPSMYYFAMSPSNPEVPDDYFGKNYLSKNIKMGIPCFMPSQYQKIFDDSKNIYYFDKFHLWGHNPFHQATIEEVKKMPSDQIQSFWSDNISHHIYHYHVMYGALQTAIYMGFEEIYLLGSDLGMEYQNPHMVFEDGLDPYRFSGTKYEYIYKSVQNKNTVKSIINGVIMKLIQKFDQSDIIQDLIGSDNNDSMTQDYFNNLRIIDRSKHESEIRKSHIISKRIQKESNVNIYNATLGGELEIYERRELKNII